MRSKTPLTPSNNFYMITIGESFQLLFIVYKTKITSPTDVTSIRHIQRSKRGGVRDVRDRDRDQTGTRI
jgi:hypothetical protein